MEITYPGFLKPLFLIRFLSNVILFAQLFVQPVYADGNGCAGGFNSEQVWPSGDRACPVLGNMGGTELAIPRNFMLGPVGYKGEDIWKNQASHVQEKGKSLDNEIESFAIAVRLSNLRPIMSKRDWDDYEKSKEYSGTDFPAHGGRWITIGFKSDLAYSNRKCSGSMKCYFDGIIKDEAHWGPYRRGKKIYGLRHYASLKGSTLEQYAGKFDEFYYDEDTQKTLITCSSTKTRIPPYKPLNFCNQNFVVPEIHATGMVYYDNPAKENIPRWESIETQIHKIIQKFIVH